MAATWIKIGEAVHEAERQGLSYLVESLPQGFVVFTNVSLPTGRRGQFFEHDAVVVAPHGVFTVELKSWSGTTRGNRDRWTLSDGSTVASPLPLVGHKSRVLKGLLERKSIELTAAWVQGLVFLSAADATAQLTKGWADLVHTRATIASAITDPRAWSSRGALSQPLLSLIESVLVDGRPSTAPAQLGDYRLLQRLDADEAPYDAWLAEAILTGERRVLHAHAVDANDDAGRKRLRERALREATLHARLRGGPDVLRYETYFRVEEDPRSIVLVFEDTTPWVAASTWVNEHSPGLAARLRAGARIARALQWVHDREFVHRRLSADAVLVSPQDDALTVRLCALDLAHDTTGRAPTLTSPTGGSLRFSAPEVVLTGEATIWSDRFALGATVAELLLGRPPFATVEALLKPVRLPPLVVGDRPVPSTVQRLIAELLSTDPQARPTATAAAEVLEREARHDGQDGPPELAPNVIVRQTYRLEQTLGRGATATSWRAVHQQTGEPRVLKIADGTHAPSLRTEATVLNQVQHPNLVRFYDLQPDGDSRFVLVLEYVDGLPLATRAAPLDPKGLRGMATGLLNALVALHDGGWLHRDVKPDNIVLRADGRPVLLDLGLACRVAGDDNLAVGTPRYKDPLVYAEERWTPGNDVYAAFLVLWEVLTGLHPFAATTPDLERPPSLVADDLPDSFSPGAAAALVDLFLRALSPRREGRPADAREAVSRIDAVLRPQASAPPVQAPESELPAGAGPEDELATLRLSTRATGALARLHLRRVGHLAALRDETLAALPNVGRKTLDEIGRVAGAVRARWPDLAPYVSPSPSPVLLAPALRGDPRTLAALGSVITQGVRRELEALGVRTVGDLAILPADVLPGRRGFGPQKMEGIRHALLRLAGDEGAPTTLDAIDDAIRKEVGDADYRLLASLVGLRSGQAKDTSAVRTDADVTRQRVSQVADLSRLRADASAASALISTVVSLLLPAGVARLDGVAQALGARLLTDGTVSPLGYARLAALILRPDARANEAQRVSLVAVAPWTEGIWARLCETLAEAANVWPPTPRTAVEARLWEALGADLQRTLIRRGADAAQLLDTLLPWVDAISTTPMGALFTPPVAMVDALRELRPILKPKASAEDLAEEVMRLLEGVEPPDDLPRALRDAGWRRDGTDWCDGERVPATVVPAVPLLDPEIPRERVAAEVPPVIRVLRASLAHGGMRVVAMPPDRQHVLSRRLHSWLVEELGEDNVAWIDVDRVILEALRGTSLWKLIPHQERSGTTDWRWLHREARVGLDAAMSVARPGRVTLLARPSLLGTLDLLTPWLTGWYERSRYGKHGLLVLAVPGVVHEQRVQLNGKYPFPYTPDMAAVYLEEAG